MNERSGPSKLPFGWLTLAAAITGAQRLEVQVVRGERLRVGLDAHRRPLPAGDADEPDARHLRQLLRDARVDEVVHLRAAAPSST